MRQGPAATPCLEGYTGSVWAAAFSPDGPHVVTASWDATARVWGWSPQGRRQALVADLEPCLSDVQRTQFLDEPPGPRARALGCLKATGRFVDPNATVEHVIDPREPHQQLQPPT